MCDPVGVAEVARLLGVSKTRVWQLRSEGHLPAPRWQLESGPLWETSEVVRYAETRPIWAGRRRRMISADEDSV